MKPTILLTGATGSVGIEALRELIRQQDRYHIRILSLDTSQERKILQPFADHAEIIWGDLRNPKEAGTSSAKWCT